MNHVNGSVIYKLVESGWRVIEVLPLVQFSDKQSIPSEALIHAKIEK